MKEPDYANYTYTELLDAYENIDRKKYPEHFNELNTYLSYTLDQESVRADIRKRSIRSRKVLAVFCGLFFVVSGLSTFFTGSPSVRKYSFIRDLVYFETQQMRSIVCFVLLVVGGFITLYLWDKDEN